MLGRVNSSRYHPVGVAFVDHHGTEIRYVQHHIPGHIQRYIFGFTQFIQRFGVGFVVFRVSRIDDADGIGIQVQP